MKTQPKDTELRDEWKRVDRALIPGGLLASMPQPECKGLTMLTDVIINATVCKLGPRVGQITAPYSDDIEIVLDVAETIEHRMRRDSSCGRPPECGSLRHLETSVRSLETGAHIEVCIVATGGVVPAIDDCVSFVLWAETGFFEPPSTLDDRILYVRDPELYEHKAKIEREARKRERRIKELRRELAREESLARSEFLSNIMLERERVRNLSWSELMAEHEAVGAPSGPVEEAAHDLRARLLESV